MSQALKWCVTCNSHAGFSGMWQQSSMICQLLVGLVESCLLVLRWGTVNSIPFRVVWKIDLSVVWKCPVVNFATLPINLINTEQALIELELSNFEPNAAATTASYLTIRHLIYNCLNIINEVERWAYCLPVIHLVSIIITYFLLGWQRKLDDKGRPYYFNYHTQQSTYQAPQAPVPQVTAQSAGAVPANTRLPPARPPTSRMGQGSTYFLRIELVVLRYRVYLTFCRE